MKVNSVIDVLGAIIFLAIVAVVARNPATITGPLHAFGDVVAQAKR